MVDLSTDVKDSKKRTVPGIEDDLVATVQALVEDDKRRHAHCSVLRVPRGLEKSSTPFEWIKKEAQTGCLSCILICDIVAHVKSFSEIGTIEIHRARGALDILPHNRNGRICHFEVFTTLDQPASPFPAIGIGSIPDSDSSSATSLNLIHKWMDTCNAKHKKCNLVQSTTLPKRILEISFDSPRSLTLIESQGKSAKFAALSHCWGDGTLPKTTSSSLMLRKNGIDWDSLPRTFQDAISVCHCLGLRFLWIDSFCIIQDDKEDWEIESSKMAEVYGNAEVVISAALSSNGDGGCFSTRSMPSGESTDHHHAVGTTQFSPELRSALGADGETFKYYVRLNGPHNHFTRTPMKSDLSHLDPLFQRTWAYQERALARRVVHFTKYELVWECRESQKCECMYLDGGPRGSMRGNGAPLKSAFVNSDFSNMQTHLENNIWHRIVEQYTRTRLTQQLDILPAISGIVKYMQDSGAGSYVAGVWLANFRQDLLWYPIRPGRRPSSYIAPSWSWASVVHDFDDEPGVRFSHPTHHPGTRQIRYPGMCPEALGLECSPVNDLAPLGAIQSASLTIRG
jgi:hypothetical protein